MDNSEAIREGVGSRPQVNIKRRIKSSRHRIDATPYPSTGSSRSPGSFRAWFKLLGARVTLFSAYGGVVPELNDELARSYRQSSPGLHAAKCYPALNQASFRIASYSRRRPRQLSKAGQKAGVARLLSLSGDWTSRSMSKPKNGATSLTSGSGLPMNGWSGWGQARRLGIGTAVFMTCRRPEIGVRVASPIFSGRLTRSLERLNVL